MTTTDTEAPAPPPDAPSGAGDEQPLAIEAAADPEKEALWTRLVLPIALPVLSLFAIVLWALNLSRAFLAGSKTSALVIVLIVTISIMAGAAMMSAMPRMRTSSKLLLVAFVICLVVSAGIVSLGASEKKEAGGGGGYQPPAGAPVGTISVVAQPGSALSFNAKEFTAKAGVNLIKYTQGTGTHTLLVDDPKFAGFELKVGPPKSESGKVQLEKGKQYTIYCSIPGHEAAGMKATITVQ
jgi:plastocyanin